MFTYGTTIEQLAEVAVSARFNAADNPEAYYRDPITVDDVLAGPMIADPFTKLHCCIRSDGGAAVVLVSAERAKDLPTKPVWVLGSGETTSHMLTSQWDDLTVGPASVSGPLAFARAGVAPSDVDVAEIYDAFTYMLLLTLEDLGFVRRGGRRVRRRGLAATGWQAAHEHRRWWAVCLPSRPTGIVPVG